MNPTAASRPHMPGYGTLGPTDGPGLLPWSWAEERLVQSHDYWLATVTPEGHPHVMPVWAVLFEDELWFSSSKQSRKARNLVAHTGCSLATQDPLEPVVVEGQARLVTDPLALASALDAENAKYGTSYGPEWIDPERISWFALTPRRVLGLDSADFVGSPTRWLFD